VCGGAAQNMPPFCWITCLWQARPTPKAPSERLPAVGDILAGGYVELQAATEAGVFSLVWYMDACGAARRAAPSALHNILYNVALAYVNSLLRVWL
jgi:hypothetical protein